MSDHLLTEAELAQLTLIGERIGAGIARKPKLSRRDHLAGQALIAITLTGRFTGQEQEAVRTADTLIAALDGTASALEVLADYVSDSDVSTEAYDRLAGEFNRDTGMLAPGKDEAAAVNSGHTHEERRAAWDAWATKRKAARLERAKAVLRAAGMGR